MQVHGPGGAGVAHRPDELTSLHRITLADVDLVEVAVEPHRPLLVGDIEDERAIALVAAAGDPPGVHRIDGRAARAQEVEAHVIAPGAQTFAPAEVDRGAVATIDLLVTEGLIGLRGLACDVTPEKGPGLGADDPGRLETVVGLQRLDRDACDGPEVAACRLDAEGLLKDLDRLALAPRAQFGRIRREGGGAGRAGRRLAGHRDDGEGDDGDDESRRKCERSTQTCGHESSVACGVSCRVRQASCARRLLGPAVPGLAASPQDRPMVLTGQCRSLLAPAVGPPLLPAVVRPGRAGLGVPGRPAWGAD